MCVTLHPAKMGGTSVLTYSVIDDDPRQTHITAYQNTAANLVPAPNFMLLHFPGSDLRLVDGPQRTRNFMRDVTRDLPQLVPTTISRGGSALTYGASSARVEAYGDSYHVVLAERVSEIPGLLSQVPESRRPIMDSHLDDLLSWYGEHFPDYVFALACFNGSVEPTYPIVVQYFPDNDDVLFAPGLDAHDGRLPVLGAPVERNFRVAFGDMGDNLPIKVRYTDTISLDWAPSSVAGFVYNTVGPNGDFVVPLLDLEMGLNGRELIADLV